MLYEISFCLFFIPYFKMLIQVSKILITIYSKTWYIIYDDNCENILENTYPHVLFHGQSCHFPIYRMLFFLLFLPREETLFIFLDMGSQCGLTRSCRKERLICQKWVWLYVKIISGISILYRFWNTTQWWINDL